MSGQTEQEHRQQERDWLASHLRDHANDIDVLYDGPLDDGLLASVHNRARNYLRALAYELEHSNPASLDGVTGLERDAAGFHPGGPLPTTESVGGPGYGPTAEELGVTVGAPMFFPTTPYGHVTTGEQARLSALATYAEDVADAIKLDAEGEPLDHREDSLVRKLRNVARSADDLRLLRQREAEQTARRLLRQAKASTSELCEDCGQPLDAHPTIPVHLGSSYFGGPGAQVYADVAAERKRADDKHGANGIGQLAASDERWLAILVEEVGEVAHVLTGVLDREKVADLRSEWVQVAAVATAAVDAIDRDQVPDDDDIQDLDTTDNGELEGF